MSRFVNSRLDTQPNVRAPPTPPRNGPSLSRDHGARPYREKIELARPKLAMATRTTFVEIPRERILFRQSDQREQCVRQFVFVADIGPGLFTDLLDRRMIEPPTSSSTDAGKI